MINDIILIATPFFTAGVAFGGVKYGLNGQREGLKRVENNMEKMGIRMKGVETDVAFMRGSLALRDIISTAKSDKS